MHLRCTYVRVYCKLPLESFRSQIDSVGAVNVASSRNLRVSIRYLLYFDIKREIINACCAHKRVFRMLFDQFQHPPYAFESFPRTARNISCRRTVRRGQWTERRSTYNLVRESLAAATAVRCRRVPFVSTLFSVGGTVFAALAPPLPRNGSVQKKKLGRKCPL